MDAIPLYIVDRSSLFRNGLKRLLSEIGFEIKGEARDLDELMAGPVDASEPNIILADAAEDEAAFIEKLACLRRGAPASRIVVLADKIGQGCSTAVLQGLDGYLLKDMSVETLKQSLCLIMQGGKVFASRLAPAVDAPSASAGGSPSEILAQMSPRERQILTALRSGLSNKEIGNRLKISDGTVKVHLKAILRKLNVRNRTQAALWATAQDIPEVSRPASPRDGGTFLAARAAEGGEPSSRVARLPGNAARGNVLIVEDETLMAMHLERAISELGYKVIGVAGKLDEAKVFFESGHFDVAVLDVTLRGGEFIYPAVDVLVSRGIPFFFVTGQGGQFRDRRYAAYPVLAKPFSRQDLAQCLKAAVPA